MITNLNIADTFGIFGFCEWLLVLKMIMSIVLSWESVWLPKPKVIWVLCPNFIRVVCEYWWVNGTHVLRTFASLYFLCLLILHWRIWLERGGTEWRRAGGEREKENIDVIHHLVASWSTLTGDWICNLSIYSDHGSNLQPLVVQYFNQLSHRAKAFFLLIIFPLVLNFLVSHWLINLYRIQVHYSTSHHLYTILCFSLNLSAGYVVCSLSIMHDIQYCKN